MRSRLARFAVVGSLALFVGASAALAACGQAEDDVSPEALRAAAKRAGTANGLCPVMKKPVIEGAANVSDYKGEKIGFCCPPCKPKFEKDPEKYMEKIRANPDLFAYHP